MELRRELLLTIGILVAINLLLAFGSIGLLVRMGPAIERILQENVYSIIAAEQMLAVIADAGGAPLSSQEQQKVKKALEHAKRNVTLEAERPVLASLTSDLPALFSGDSSKRHQAIRSIQQLIRINRQAMSKVDQRARRLGNAGAWAAVLIGLASFLLSVLVIVRLQKRFVRPLVNLHEVLEGAHQGNRLRRCQLSDAPSEVRQVMQSVNRLLDEKLQRTAADADN